eukprot:scaffold281929_cov30-Tisochrysis_lutea.AAC.1
MPVVRLPWSQARLTHATRLGLRCIVTTLRRGQRPTLPHKLRQRRDPLIVALDLGKAQVVGQIVAVLLLDLVESELQHQVAEVLVAQGRLHRAGVEDDVVARAHIAFFVEVLSRWAEREWYAQRQLVSARAGRWLDRAGRVDVLGVADVDEHLGALACETSRLRHEPRLGYHLHSAGRRAVGTAIGL